MAITNYERVGRGLASLKDGLRPFVMREMEAALGTDWKQTAVNSLSNYVYSNVDDPNLDAYALLLIMWDNWHEVFRTTLGHSERSLVSELREVRNNWAHQRPFSTDDTYRALDSMTRLLTAISAKEARVLDNEKQDLLRLKYEAQARHQRRKAATVSIEGDPQAGLQAWREIVTPHPDVASGRYQQAEFAADLAAVYDNAQTTGDEYRDPVAFFERTYLTQGLEYLLSTALQRLTNQGGDPIVELQTNFGGGKTHAMLALYHLFSGTKPSQLAGIEPLLEKLGIHEIPTARRAVLVGTALTPGQPTIHSDGVQTNTLWGELAWQLGDTAGDGRAGYAMLETIDKNGISPGSNLLRELFTRYSPCLILIDEWVAYTRQLFGKTGMPSGSFESNITFVQALTEAAKLVPGVMVVASLPASQIEIGGTGGQEALAQIRNTFGRVESAWRPATAEEGFEIVRRRLFQPIRDPRLYATRDNVIKAYSAYYQEQADEFPPECREADYQRRMTAAYPIHPELFDQLYGTWSTLDKFQRTRGVLRLMAAVIHNLWEREDRSLMIMPANIPVGNPAVQSELTHYLEDNWLPVIEKDVDGVSSLPLTLDRGNPNLGRYSATRRVARTIYMGSAPTSKNPNPGLDARNIKLGCVQPGESVATFGDALRRLTDQATHLYVDRSRYWFSTQPSVTRLAQDRAVQFQQADVWQELIKRLRQDRQRGELAGVHIVPASSGDVPDEARTRLVILGPETPHANRTENSLAMQSAREIMRQRGNSPRLYQNMVVFLAPDRSRLEELEEGIRQYMAWSSIYNERTQLNLDNFQTTQAKTRYETTNETVESRISQTYTWLLVPFQSDARRPDSLNIDEYRLQGSDPLAVRASRRLINDELLITKYGGIRLQMEMNNQGLWPETKRLSTKQLWEYFARYPYLARLRDESVLQDAIAQGVASPSWNENFAYAQAWDEEAQRYLGLLAGQSGSVLLDSTSVLVHPNEAQRQLDEDQARHGQATSTTSTGDSTPPIPSTGDATGSPTNVDDNNSSTDTGSGSSTGVGHSTTTGGGYTPTPKPKATRFYGVVELDEMRIGLDAGQIGESIILHLAKQPGAKITVTLEIQAELPDGVSDSVIRTVTENANTLKFSDFGFEEDA